MAQARPTIRTSKRIAAGPVHDLFQRMQWSDWFTLDETRWYLDHALYVVSAWVGKKCVGVGVLVGDGRISAFLTSLVVDAPCQGQGIGTALMQKIVDRVERFRPYYFGLDVFERRTERFYARFGFVRNKGTWLLEHKPTADRLRAAARQSRAARNRHT